MDAPMPKIVYHYCNLPVLDAIMTNSTIRLTDKRFDIAKLCKFYNDVQNLELTKNTMKQLGMSDSDIEFGIAAAQKKLNDIIVYACCFSRFGDSPDEWFYAEDGNGVCLGFDTDVLSTLSPYLRFQFVTGMPMKDFVAMPKKFDEASTHEFAAQNTAFAKFDGDPKERAYRLVYIGTHTKGTDEISNFAHHRGAMVNRDGDKVEFFDIKLPMAKILKEVCIGPKCDPEQAKALLEKAGIDLSSVDIQLSKN
ncbi:MAG: hypothetical protein IKV41_02165 [Oscillospiraceae bacterium]|nr:hypothetical protein [Oscillospiraceae bacterium]